MLKPSLVIGDIPSSYETYKNFYKIAWPSALEALLVGLVGSVDTMMVGTMGEGAIAAVGITNQPKFILLAMVFSLNVGITAVTARRKGQQDQAGANHTMRAGILITITLSLITSLLGFLFAGPILTLAGAESNYLADAITYFRVLMFSIPFQALNLTINAAQRGCGKTKISMTTNIISNVVNIIFNFFLINGIGFFPRLEVKGAAIATCMGAVVACIISVTTLFRRSGYLSIHHKSSWKLNAFVLQPIFKVSGSAFIEQHSSKTWNYTVCNPFNLHESPNSILCLW
ncbi:MAG: hypothetical protein K0S47_4231 [Herbinix sp.]|nr:hypothetical protein [Herbinix sp.]